MSQYANYQSAPILLISTASTTIDHCDQLPTVQQFIQYIRGSFNKKIEGSWELFYICHQGPFPTFIGSSHLPYSYVNTKHTVIKAFSDLVIVLVIASKRSRYSCEKIASRNFQLQLETILAVARNILAVLTKIKPKNRPCYSTLSLRHFELQFENRRGFYLLIPNLTLPECSPTYTVKIIAF